MHRRGLMGAVAALALAAFAGVSADALDIEDEGQGRLCLLRPGLRVPGLHLRRPPRLERRATAAAGPPAARPRP